MIKKALSTFLLILLASASFHSQAQEDMDIEKIRAMGKQVVADRKKGNCVACHVIEDMEAPGTFGPPLIAMSARYPDKAKLRAQIWDATRRNMLTSMPPFGKHMILTEEEIDWVTEYIYSL